MKPVTLCYRLLMPAAAAVLGVVAAGCSHQNPPAAVSAVDITTGRHLEPAWWEAISFSATPTTPQMRTVTIVIPSDILFATDSYTVDAQGKAIITQKIAPLLKGASTVTLAGATDHTGSSALNYALGLHRAQACKVILAAAGVPDSIIQTISWGDTHPVANGNGPDPEAAMAQDRRVTVIAEIPKSSSSGAST